MKKNCLSKRLLSLLLCLALFLSLGFSAYAEGPGENETQDEGERTATEEPEISPVEDAPMADYAVFVYIVDDTTGAFPQHGAVNLMGDYQAFPYEEYRYMVARGDTLTVSAVPDEGYALDTETFRATYRSSSTSSVDRDLPLDETNAFTVPDRGVYSITIHVTFASIYDGYGIFVNVLDLMGTGNTVTADRDRAEEGDLITLTVHMNEGTRFAVPGLEVYKDGGVTVSFDPCGGTVEPESVEVTIGVAVGTLPVPEREGNWVFLGWFTEPAETAFVAGQGAQVTPESVFDEDATVYAHWRLPGDINGDGEVNNKDLTRLQRYLKCLDV